MPCDTRERFTKWMEDKVADGLVDMHVTYDHAADPEHVMEELMHIDALVEKGNIKSLDFLDSPPEKDPVLMEALHKVLSSD